MELDRTLACKGGDLKKTKQKKTTTKKDVHYLKKHHEVSSDTITAGQVPSAKKNIKLPFRHRRTSAIKEVKNIFAFIQVFLYSPSVI